jgi:hypothetical protein
MAVDDTLEGGDTPSQEGGEKPSLASIDLEKMNETINATVNRSLEESLAPVMGELGKVVGQQNRRIDELGKKEEEVSPNAEVEALLSKPGEVIAEYVARAGNQNKPLVEAIVLDRRTTHEAAEASKFDSTYGEGKYQELLAKPVAEILSNYPPEHLVKREGIAAAVDVIKGGMVDDLVELKLANDKKVAAEKEMAYGSLGPGRPSPNTKEGLTPEEKEIVSSFAKAGYEEGDEKSYAAMKGIEPTLSAYMKYKESQNAR